MKTWIQRSIGMMANAAECYAGGLLMLSIPLLTLDIYGPGQQALAIQDNFLLYGLSLWSYPLGSLMFGWLGDAYGRRPALLTSLSVMGFALLILILCPKQTSLTPWIIFATLSLYHMGSGAELSGGALFSLEHSPKNRQGRVSGYISTYSILGILLSSGVIFLLQHFHLPLWGGFYGAIFLIALVFLGVLYAKEPPTYTKDISQKGWKVRWQSILACFMVSSVFGIAYYVPFVFLPQMMVKISPLTLEKTASSAPIGLTVYLLSLWGTGFLADPIGIQRLMRQGALLLALISPLALLLAWQGTWGSYLLAQGLLAAAAGVFISPSHALMASLFPPHSRYRIISFTYAMAFTCVGASTPIVLNWLYDTFLSLLPLIAWLTLWFMGTYAILRNKSLKTNA